MTSLPLASDRARRVLRRVAVAHVARPQRRLVREALGVQQMMLRRSGLDPARWRVVEVTTHHEPPQDEHLGRVAAVQGQCWQRGAVVRLCVQVELVDVEGVEQLSTLISWSHRIDDDGVPTGDNAWLWSAGVRDRFDEECEPFVDARSLAAARAALDGESRGGGGVLTPV